MAASAATAAPGILGLRRQHLVAAEERRVAGTRDGQHARDRARRVEVELHACVGVRRAHHDGLEHAGQRDVGDEPRRAGHAPGPREPRGGMPDDGQLAGIRPGLDVIVRLDEHPAILEPALHLDLRPHEPRH